MMIKIHQCPDLLSSSLNIEPNEEFINFESETLFNEGAQPCIDSIRNLINTKKSLALVHIKLSKCYPATNRLLMFLFKLSFENTNVDLCDCISKLPCLPESPPISPRVYTPQSFQEFIPSLKEEVENDFVPYLKFDSQNGLLGLGTPIDYGLFQETNYSELLNFQLYDDDIIIPGEEKDEYVLTSFDLNDSSSNILVFKKKRRRGGKNRKWLKK